MNYKDKQLQLQKILKDNLLPLITNDYLLLDDPYHKNIGDSLIWGGEKNLTALSEYRCKYSTSFNKYVSKRFSKDTVILLHGGGNWGDIWRPHQEFRMRIMDEFPENPIVIFPQTVFYNDKKTYESDMDFINKHQNVVCCARDRNSYDLLTARLDNKVLLLPDMAFMTEYPASDKKTGRTLFVKRLDKEMANYDRILPYLPKDYDEHDWPTVEHDYPIYYPNIAVRALRKFLCHVDVALANKIDDYYWDHTLLPFTIKTGVDFLNQYDTIYTTRLHVAILGTLMGKEVILFDNSYGKNKNFYEAWLSDVDNIKLVDVK